MDKDDAEHLFTQIGVRTERSPDEVIDPGDGLYASEASTGDNERQQRPLFLTAFRVRFFQVSDQVISKTHGVGECLHGQRVVF